MTAKEIDSLLKDFIHHQKFTVKNVFPPKAAWEEDRISISKNMFVTAYEINIIK